MPRFALCLVLSLALAAPAAAKPRASFGKRAALTAKAQRVKTAARVRRAKEAKQARQRYVEVRKIGDRLYNSGAYEEALEVWGRLLEVEPKDLSVLERVAAAHVRLGQFWVGAKRYERILDLMGPPPYKSRRKVGDIFSGKLVERPEAYHLNLARLAHTWSLLGDHGRALEAAEVVADWKGDVPFSHTLLADAHMHAGQYGEADLIYQDILADDPDNGGALNNMSTLRYLQRDLDGTMELLEKVLSSHRHSRLEAIALSNVAEVLMLRGDYANARGHYEAAIDAYPEGSFSHFGMAALQDVTGEPTAAIDSAITGWDLDRGGLDRHHSFYFDEEWSFQRDAHVAEAEGRFDDALEAWEAIVVGNVKRLVRPARHHVARLQGLLDQGL